MSGCMASARDRRRSIGQRYHAKAMPHAMRLNAMLIWNKASEGIIKPSYYFQNWPAENPTKRKSFLGRLLSYAIRQPTPEPLKLHASLLDVSYWRKTDIDADVEHVRFWG
jgi:hypothetical protein